MPTASTKQRDPKMAQKSGESSDARPLLARDEQTWPAPVAAAGADITERVWRWGSVLVLFVAAALRLLWLGLKPLHHDEGVNAFFLTDLLYKGVYHYNPENYHGPTIYYFALPFAQLIGLTTVALRLVPALCGIATVWLILCLRRYVGAVAALLAAALLAVSPGAVYYSRYFIHESLFAFFTLGIVVAAARYYDTARPLYLMLAAACAGLLFATKETAFISAGVLALATLLAWWYVGLASDAGWRWWRPSTARGGGEKPRAAKRDARRKGGGAKAWSRFGSRSRLVQLALGATALFLFVNVLFYSSFFTYAEGLQGALQTFKLWSKRTSVEHTKPLTTYLKWLLQEESPLLILGVIGGASAAARPVRNRFAVFAAAWACGLLLAYSLIGYKTPWLVLSFLVPLALCGGYGVSAFDRRGGGNGRRRIAILALAGAALAVSLYQTVQLNFNHYDDEAYPYVYVHTRREMLQLVAEVDRLAALAGTGQQTTIAIASPDYWPLPWYLRAYKHVGFHGQIGSYTDQIIIGKEGKDENGRDLEETLRVALGPNYIRVGPAYTLRPGVNLVLYVRRDVAGR